MKIDDKIIDRLAELAKLEFDSNSKETIKKDLNKILEFIDQLNKVDTEGIAPLTHVLDEVNHLREDQVNNEVSTEQALKNAPKKDSDYFKVPKVIDKED